jgi:hypothetical protein
MRRARTALAALAGSRRSPRSPGAAPIPFHFNQLMEEDRRHLAPMERSLESPAMRGVLVEYRERRMWHLHEQIDRTTGIDRIPEELRVVSTVSRSQGRADFHQRFGARVSADRIEGRWDASEDQGATWRKDFDLIFERTAVRDSRPTTATRSSERTRRTAPAVLDSTRSSGSHRERK